MSEWYNHPNVFIRSLATRGALGGLHPKIIEIADLMKSADFDYIIIETVGVGQSEVDIAGLADITVVLLVPEGGDVIQTMKAGLMEVADIFVVNKFDRPGAEIFYNQLKKMLVPEFHNRNKSIPIMKTVASSKEGIGELYKLLNEYQSNQFSDNKVELMAQKVWTLMQSEKMKGVDIIKMKKELASELLKENFNLYRFARKYLEG
jgi:LAO/AO transport system kinase